MDSSYYRAIARLCLRVAADPVLRTASTRLRDDRNQKKSDRKRIKAWMVAYCDLLEGNVTVGPVGLSGVQPGCAR